MKMNRRYGSYSLIIHNQARRYAMLGFHPDRIAKLPGMPSPETIFKWCKTENWDEEFQKIAKRTQEKRIERLSDELAEMDRRQLRRLMKMYKKIDSHLDPEVESDAQALMHIAKALEVIIKNERLIRGQATERRESKSEISVTWKDIIYATVMEESNKSEIYELDNESVLRLPEKIPEQSESLGEGDTEGGSLVKAEGDS